MYAKEICFTDSNVGTIDSGEIKWKFEPISQHCIHNHRMHHTTKYKTKLLESDREIHRETHSIGLHNEVFCIETIIWIFQSLEMFLGLLR